MVLFKEIFIADIEKVTKKEIDSLIMCGSKNWDFYFLKSVANYDEKLENIYFIEFDTEVEMHNYIENNEKNVIDYSIEHNTPCILTKN